MRLDKEKTLDGHVYRVTQFGAGEALRVWTKLVKIAGPSLGKAAAGIKTGAGASVLDGTFNFDAIGLAVEALADKLDEADVVPFANRLLAGTLRDGNKINFELDFRGEIMHLFKVLAFVLEANYGDFFDVLGALQKSAESKTTSTSISANGPNGQTQPGALSGPSGVS